jgi:hypothetical protein
LKRCDFVDFGLASHLYQPSGRKHVLHLECVQLDGCLSRSYWYTSYSCDFEVRVAADSTPCSAFEVVMRYGKVKPDAQP